MDVDDVVLPSDPEELEEMRAEKDLEGYWTDVLPTITKNIERMQTLTGTDYLKVYGASSVEVSAVKPKAKLSEADDANVSDPPRKRVKVRSAVNVDVYPQTYILSLGHSYSLQREYCRGDYQTRAAIIAIMAT